VQKVGRQKLQPIMSQTTKGGSCGGGEIRHTEHDSLEMRKAIESMLEKKCRRGKKKRVEIVKSAKFEGKKKAK